MSDRVIRPALLLALLLATALPSHAERSSNGIVVAAGQQRGEILSFGEPVSIAGSVSGDVQLAGANATVDGSVDGDLVVLFGDANITDGARITGDVICVGGRVLVADDAEVGGEILTPGNWSGALRSDDPSSSVRQKPFSLVAAALKLSLLFAWLIVSVILSLASGREIRAASQELRASRFHTLVLGAVAFTSCLITAVVLSYLISFMVGIPLLVLLGAFALLTKIFGMVAVFHAVGTLVAGAKTTQDQEKRRFLRGDLAMVVTGLLILGAVRMIPFVGNVVWAIASLYGIGASLATKFGRREPWFLAWPAVTQRAGR